jgi:hypothetical protein
MGSPEDLVSHHITVLRRCGLSDEDICEVYGVADPPDDVSVGRVVMESLDGEPTPRNLYDQTHRVLATATRGIDAPRDYPDRVVPQQLNTVMGAFGFSMYFLDGSGEPLDSGAEPSQPFRIALEDPNGNVRTTTFEYPDTALGEQNYPALVAAIQSELLDGVPLTFAMLSDWAEERWRFVLFEADRLDALEEHYGDGIDCFGEPLLHKYTPAEFASGQAVAEPAVEAAAGSGSNDAGGDSDGDIGVDESTEGWLGSGGSDLSDVDLDGSGTDDTTETADGPEVETGLEDIFSTIEEDATAGGDGSVEIESTDKTVEDLIGAETTGTADELAEVEPAAEAEAESAAEPDAEQTAEAEPDPATEAESDPATEAEPATADPETGDVTATESPEPETASEATAEAEPTPTTDEPATAESGSLDAEDDDGGFVTADPEPARTETEEPAVAGRATESADQPADDDPADAVSSADPVGTEQPAEETEQPAEAAETAAEPASGPAEGSPEPAVESTSEPAESEPTAASGEPADAPADAAESAGETTATATPEPANADPERTDATATADEPAATSTETADGSPADEPTAGAGEPTAESTPATADGSPGDEPTATAEPATEDPATDDAGATEPSDDSPGLVGRIVGAIKALF